MSAESLFLSRQLEHIRPKVLEVKYPNLMARKVLPVVYEGGPGDSMIVQQVEDATGEAQVVSDKARDLQTVNENRREYSSPIRDLGIAFEYSRRELAAAAKNGIQLAPKRAMSARKVMERGLDRVAFQGDSTYNLPGFANNSQITPSNVANDGTGSSTLWVNKTEDQILRDLFDAANALSNNSKGAFEATDILLPLAKYNFIASKPMGVYRNATILSFFLQTYPKAMSVTPWYKLAGAGASSTDRMIVYQRDPEVLALSIQQEFDMLPPQEAGLMVSVPCTLVTAGVLIDQPLGVAYRDGI